MIQRPIVIAVAVALVSLVRLRDAALPSRVDVDLVSDRRAPGGELGEPGPGLLPRDAGGREAYDERRTGPRVSRFEQLDHRASPAVASASSTDAGITPIVPPRPGITRTRSIRPQGMRSGEPPQREGFVRVLPALCDLIGVVGRTRPAQLAQSPRREAAPDHRYEPAPACLAS